MEKLSSKDLEQLKGPTTKESTKQTPSTTEYISDDFLPDAFDFFGMGKLHTKAKAFSYERMLNAEHVISFKLTGEYSGLCLIGFDKFIVRNAMDASMYTELANILVGKFVSSIVDYTQSEVSYLSHEMIPSVGNKHRYLSSLLEGVRRGRQSRLLGRLYEYKSSNDSCGLQFMYIANELSGSV